MKLLSKREAESAKKKENDSLVEKNIKLRAYLTEVTTRIANAKQDYGAEKLKALEDFEKFTQDLNEKKSILWKEALGIERLIEQKKEAYYALIEKQDQLEEREYLVNEKEKKLDLRENFIKELEKQWATKTK